VPLEGLVNIMNKLYCVKLMSCVMHYYVSSDTVQCYNCSDFNHFSDKCTSPSVCGKCASTQHKTKDCTSDSFLNVLTVFRHSLPNDAHPACTPINVLSINNCNFLMYTFLCPEFSGVLGV